MLDKMPACERDLTYLNRVLVITLHLACLLTRETPKAGTEEHDELHRAIYELVKINAKGKQVCYISKKIKIFAEVIYFKNC